jgi:iron complex transport system permease protein
VSALLSGPSIRAPGAVGSLLVLLLVALALASASAGAVPVPLASVAAVLLGPLGPSVEVEPVHAMVLTDIRLPRIALAVLVGSGLGLSGALQQGLFRNPLADPGLVGVSSGAALGAAMASILGAFGGPVALAAAAFGGGALASVVALALARRGKRAAVGDLLLAGIAVNALCGAGVGLLVFVADDASLRSFTFWTLGSLGGATWPTLGIAAAGIGPAALAGLLLARPLDVLLLGETEARTLGVALEPLKGAIVALVALAVGTATALCGIVGFIGLVAPHLVRLAVGPSHRLVVPGSLGVGAALLLAADLAARTLVSPAELPVGVLTTLIGAPFLLWLLGRGAR